MKDTDFSSWKDEPTMFVEWVKDLNDTVGGCEFCGNTAVIGKNEHGERYCAGCYADFMGSVDEQLIGWAR